MRKYTYLVERLIQSIALSRFKNNYHGEFNEDVLHRAKETPAIVTNMAAQLAAYEDAIVAETAATFKSTLESITDTIYKKLVPARDSKQTGFKGELRAKMESSDPQVASDAAMLFELAHKHELHTDMETVALTDAIRDYVADVETNHAEALQRVDTEGLFLKLKQANDAVHQAFMERTEMQMGIEPAAMANARKQTDSCYRELCYAVEAYAYVQGITEYKDFIKFLNALIKFYKSKITNGTAGSEGSGEGVVDDEVVEDETTDTEEEEEEEETTNIFTATWLGPNNEVVATQQYEAGQHIVPPEPPAGYIWNYHPNYMPAENLTITCLLDDE